MQKFKHYHLRDDHGPTKTIRAGTNKRKQTRKRSSTTSVEHKKASKGQVQFCPE